MFAIVLLLIIPLEEVSASTCSFLGMFFCCGRLRDPTEDSLIFFFENKKKPVPNIQAFGVVEVN